MVSIRKSILSARNLTASCFFIMTLGAALFACAAPSVLSPDKIAVIANRQDAHSIDLATFYMKKRNIPLRNLIIIDIDPAEECSRSDFDHLIASPVRTFLNNSAAPGAIRCLVTLYGVPLKITSPSLSAPGRETVTALKQEIEQITLSLKTVTEGDLLTRLQNSLSRLKKQVSYYKKIYDMRASVDSELSLVQRVHPLSHWLPNPFYRGMKRQFLPIAKDDVLWVSRLDASSPDLVKRIITDSLQAEKKGLQGSAYFDARWPDPGLQEVHGYALYDRSIHWSATVARKSRKLQEVVLDDKNSLMQPGIGKAALYCGWYRRANYSDSFNWQTGAVGYHIASSECTTLKKKESRVWCKLMLEKGVAATIGPVGEPYVSAFPPPDLFFSFLLSGKSLIESYFFSLPHLSWKMVLVGDPLYTPFASGQANRPPEKILHSNTKGSYQTKPELKN